MKRLTDQENQFQCDQVKKKKMMNYGQEEMKCLKGKERQKLEVLVQKKQKADQQ